ncbi:MAG: helix-turn-helix transcriptional regulator [Oscillospiraceae bacterium]|nr:helix-turn-helix transcriptional regulator [Oscillospiraceae bacterium]
MIAQKSLFDSDLMIKSVLHVSTFHLPSELAPPQKCYRKSDALIYVVSGEGAYVLNGKKHIIKSGDALFISNGTTYHREILSKEYHTICVDFYFATPENIVLPTEIFQDFDNIGNCFKKLYKVWTSHTTGYFPASLALIYEIYSQMLIKKAKTYVSKKTRETLSEIHEIFLNSYRDKISICELEESLNMSAVHFRRLFKTIYGTSPQQYILSLRINTEKELLRMTSKPIKEISDEVGFSDNCYFSRLFHIKTGFTPLEYRENFSL